MFVFLLAGCAAGTVTKKGAPAAKASSAEAKASEAAKEPTGPTQFDFGGTATVTEGGDDAMTIVVTAPKFAKNDQSGFSKPEKGTFVVFNVLATAIKQHDINPFDFYVRGPDGSHYEGAFAQFDPQLNAVTLNPAEKVRGNIVFDVPARTGTLVYAPASTALGEWKF